MNKEQENFEIALRALDREKAKAAIQDCCASQDTIQCVEEVLVPVMERIGRDWEQGTLALAQVYMSGRISEEIIEQMMALPDVVKKKHPPMAIVTFQDHHSLGKRLVHSALTVSGFDIKDYGAGIGIDELVSKVGADKVSILLVSTLMLNSALKIRVLKEALETAHLTVRLVVGGAPFRFDKHLCTEVGADATADSATDAIGIVTRLVKEVTP
jgi:trimethylamine corrinoid protein